jgi:dTDP-4-dehydrorhamnose 3,5-epimerase
MLPASRSLRAEPASLSGCFELFPAVHRDARGLFVKTFHEQTYAAAGLATRFVEEYYSVSKRRVLRGLHFQVPPHGHEKLVYCTQGDVLDVVVDLRVGSPTFSRHQTFRLGARRRNILYIPVGLAHGFYVLSASATLVYKTTRVHSEDHDRGVRWDSAGIPWSDPDPIVSDRDRSLPPLAEFQSPFRYDAL